MATLARLLSNGGTIAPPCPTGQRQGMLGPVVTLDILSVKKKKAHHSLHGEKKRQNNKWPIRHVLLSLGKIAMISIGSLNMNCCCQIDRPPFVSLFPGAIPS